MSAISGKSLAIEFVITTKTGLMPMQSVLNQSHLGIQIDVEGHLFLSLVQT